jgi:hypothetical protein
LFPISPVARFSGGVTWNGNTADGEYMNAQAVLQYPAHEPDEFIGELIFTAEEEERILQIRKDIDSYVRQSIVDFIRGNRDIEDNDEWIEYVNEYTGLELHTLLQTAQTAFDRMNGK